MEDLSSVMESCYSKIDEVPPENASSTSDATLINMISKVVQSSGGDRDYHLLFAYHVS